MGKLINAEQLFKTAGVLKQDSHSMGEIKPLNNRDRYIADSVIENIWDICEDNPDIKIANVMKQWLLSNGIISNQEVNNLLEREVYELYYR